MPQGDDARSGQSDLVGHHKRAWVLLLAGLTIGFLGMYLTVTRPMQMRARELQIQMNALQSNMAELVGVRDQVRQTDSLLGSLKSQQRLLSDARQALETVRQLRTEVEAEAEQTIDAMAELKRMTSLQTTLIEQRKNHLPAVEALGQMITLREAVIDEHKSTSEAVEALNGMAELQQRVTAEADSTAAAATALQKFSEMTSQMVGQADNLDDAQTSLKAFIALKDGVANELDSVVDAVETLEVLSDFQHEFDQQMRALAGMRRSLMEIVLMESTVGRVARVLDPLIQLGQLRRLSDAEVRDAARMILEQRTTRLSQKDTPVKRIPPGDAAVPSYEAPFDERVEENMFEGLVPWSPQED